MGSGSDRHGDAVLPPPFIVSRSLSHWMQNGCLAVALSVEGNGLNRSVAADQLAGQLIVAL